MHNYSRKTTSNFKLQTLNNAFPVMEHFYTIQGEGYNTGKAAFFIRLGGCDVGCLWCDVKESWNANAHAIISVKDLLSEAKNYAAKNVVITGGEPCMYDLNVLCDELKKNKINRWLETSGAYKIKGTFEWICVSPKKFKAPLKESLKKADELKVVVFNKTDFDWAEQNRVHVKKNCKLFLQPEYGNLNKVMPLIIDYVKQNPQWQISLQTHKIMQIP